MQFFNGSIAYLNVCLPSAILRQSIMEPQRKSKVAEYKIVNDSEI